MTETIGVNTFVASQLPPIPTSKEIAKDNALFFEPEDSKALRDLMKRMADPQDKAGLKTENHEATLKKYSWEKCAQAVYEVLIH